MKKLISSFARGDMTLRFREDREGRVELELFPADCLPKETDCSCEPVSEYYVRGDNLPDAFAGGATMAYSGSRQGMKMVRQREEGEKILTLFRDEERKRELLLHLTCPKDCAAFSVRSEFRNIGSEPVTLEMLESCFIGGLTPLEEGEAQDTLELYTATSSWSAEGRLVCQSIEDLNLETSWSRHGVRVYKIGQKGALPVRGYFPFMAVRDKKKDVSWAISLGCASSWQLEARRKDYGLTIGGGLADYDYGHWAKEIAPGESFLSPELRMTVCHGSAEEAAGRLLEYAELVRPKKLALPPVMFNEYCTTWGEPSHENLSKIVEKLKGKGMEYLVIDAGWYKNEKYDWSQTGGDWIVAEKLLFPEGLKKTTDMIRAAGMIPGLWFELETCGPLSEMHNREEMLLKRNGNVIDTGARRFLDMRLPEVKDYLEERVIGTLKKYHFGYIKTDYNDCIGIGCDGAESLGEGLRQNIAASQEFFRHLRAEIPEITMENCSSGGHRLEPSMMGLFDMASFSDAHECTCIPIIAGNLHRLILPMQSQIWAVLHGSDSMKRLHYSMVSAFLGAMCLSGDIYTLSPEQWDLVEKDIAFYRQIRHIIASGKSTLQQPGVTSYTAPKGYQILTRKNKEGETLVICHTFGANFPEEISLTPAFLQGELAGKVLSPNADYTWKDGKLTWKPDGAFDAAAFYLR